MTSKKSVLVNAIIFTVGMSVIVASTLITQKRIADACCTEMEATNKAFWATSDDSDENEEE